MITHAHFLYDKCASKEGHPNNNLLCIYLQLSLLPCLSPPLLRTSNSPPDVSWPSSSSLLKILYSSSNFQIFLYSIHNCQCWITYRPVMASIFGTKCPLIVPVPSEHAQKSEYAQWAQGTPDQCACPELCSSSEHTWLSALHVHWA